MAFTRSQRNSGGGKRDKFGNSTKNIFCQENESKNGTWGYKGFFEINNRLYSVYFKAGSVQDNKGRSGAWATITEYSKQ